MEGGRMWGYSLSFWQAVVIWTMWAAFGLTALGAAAALVSSFIAWQVSDITQADADKRIAEAGTAAAKANEAAAKAHERAAGLEKEAAELRAQAESDRLARLKIEARIAPRSMTQAQQNDIAAKLAPFKGARATIIASPSTPESEMFTRVLGSPLREAGLVVEFLPGTSTATVLYPTGVIIRYPMVLQTPGTIEKPFGPWTVLADALNEIGIAATALPWPIEAAMPIAMAITVSEK